MPASPFLQPSATVPQCGLYCHPSTPQFHRSPFSSPQAQIVKRHSSSSANLLKSRVPPKNESQASAVGESLTFTSATEPVLKGPAINLAGNLSDSSKDSDDCPYSSIRKRIIDAIRLKSPVDDSEEGCPEIQRFDGVEQEDYDCVIDAIGDDENLVYNLKISFAPNLKRLIIFKLNTPIHESLRPMQKSMDRALDTMPLNDDSGITLDVLMNMSVVRELDGTVMGTPDLLLQIEGRDSLPHPLWIAEVAFSQTDEEATDKMQGHVDAQSDIIACTLFNIEETAKFSSPRHDSRIAKTLRDDYLPSIDEVASDNLSVWLNPLYVTMTTWIRPLEGPFNLNDSLDSADCMTVELSPNRDSVGLEQMQGFFQRILHRVRDATIDRLKQDRAQINTAAIDALHSWMAPTNVIDMDKLMERLNSGAKKTAYNRFCRWRKRCLKAQAQI